AVVGARVDDGAGLPAGAQDRPHQVPQPLRLASEHHDALLDPAFLQRLELMSQEGPAAPGKKGLRRPHPIRVAGGEKQRGGLHVRPSIGVHSRSGGPMYSSSGRMSRLSVCCSMTWAIQPGARLAAKIAVNRSMSKPSIE